MKKIFVAFCLVACASAFVCDSARAQNQSAEIRLDREALRPRFRQWASPANGTVVTQNPPSLLWPVGDDKKNVKYRVRLSQDSTFTGDVMLTEPMEWAVYAVHEPLDNGRWYWQWAKVGKGGKTEWSKTNDFVVDSQARDFTTPKPSEVVERIASTPHHRLYVSRNALQEFRMRNSSNEEAQLFLKNTRAKLDMDLAPIAPTRPRDTTGMSAFEKKNMIRFMYHKFGEVVTQPAVDFSIAYLLTGEEEFAHAAVRHAVYASGMPVDSDATSEDFNRSAIMYGLSVAYDTVYDFLTPDQRSEILKAIKVRADRFYRAYMKKFEVHSMDNHVWQHTFRNFFFSAIATVGDLPEAEKWVRYCYEVWCGRFPILGGDDGGWHDGNSYFEANIVSFIYIPFVLTRLLDVDFFDLPWYRNMPDFLAYSYPKNSYATGFGDNYEKCVNPPAQYIGYADALARETSNPLARWYADNLIGGDDSKLYRSKTFMLYRLLTDKPRNSVEAAAPEPSSSRFFPDAGFSLMHTDVSDSRDDFMLSFFALPFGSTGHAHAAHNGFTMSYGGESLFTGTGYYSNFNDKHTLMHYRTRGHNTVLADNFAQAIGENSYGWLARFEDNEDITYTLGDASHAYDMMRTPFWIDRMKKSGVEYSAENGFGDPGVTRFRRHFVFLKPDIVVIYDELEARNPVSWTWMIHSRNNMTELGPGAVESHNTSASIRMDLFTDSTLETKVHDRYMSPAVNWKQRAGNDGKPMEYKDQWHGEFTPSSKSRVQRFIAVFRLTPEGMTEKVLTRKGTDRFKVGDWKIKAELDASRPACLEIKSKSKAGIRYNTRSSSIDGSTVIYSPEGTMTELVDVLPPSIE